MSLVECVPNFSDGRSDEVLAALVSAVESVGEAHVLDASRDVDHNRCVVTWAAPTEVAVEAAFRVIAEAIERIDLRAHRGVHPRIGAADVCPFVPLGGTSREECVELAHALGRRLGEELRLPVYYYGDAARGRRSLPEIRRGGLEGLRRRLGGDPPELPDEGPPVLHPSAGATAVGVRPFLIAFNVNLESGDLGLARRIAATIRERDGGLPGVRALGLRLETEGVVQVSTNVCDHRLTGLLRVYEAVEREARLAGVEVRESELIGLAPREALDEATARRVRLRDFDPGAKIVEELLRERRLGPGTRS